MTRHTAKGFPPGARLQGLSSPGSDSDVEGEMEAFGGRLLSNMISSISETELDLSSASSSGRSSHLTNSIEEASSPGSEGELEPELEVPGVMGIKGALLRDAGREEQEVPEQRGSPAELKTEGYYDSLNPTDPSVPPEHTDVPSPSALHLELDPDHGLESVRRSFYLPVGPPLLPAADDDDNSEYDSDSESEPDLSEDSDSPWLLSNLVNKMISEGSYPIKCPDECFQQQHSLCDTISPASDLHLLHMATSWCHVATLSCIVATLSCIVATWSCIVATSWCHMATWSCIVATCPLTMATSLLTAAT
eukprot:XP_025009103.1 C-Jun-amino-terminal kinase-interacting protein 2-like [Gallus gallus]